MGSINSQVDCPNCGFENANEDYNYRTDEVSVYCSDCGYYKSIVLERDEEGNVKKNKKGHYKYKTTEVIPYAAYKIESNRGGSSMGCIENEEQLDRLKTYALQRARGDNVKSIEISRVIDGEVVKKRLKLGKKGKKIISAEDPYGEEEW